MLDGLKKALAKHNAVPAATGTFARNTLDVSAAINTVKAAKPDVVVLVRPYAPVAEIVKKSHAAGWKPLFTTVSFVGTEEFIQAGGKDAEGVVISQGVCRKTEMVCDISAYKRCFRRFPQRQAELCQFRRFR